MRRKYIFLLVLLSALHLLPLPASSQKSLSFNFQPLRLRDSDLSSQQTMCIMQDSRGFIWIGTQGGLNRFDGYNFHIYKHDAKDITSLGGDYIKSVFEDRNGNIVINTNNTVDVYHPKLDRFTHVGSRESITDSIAENSTFAVHAIRLRNKQIFFVSDNELFTYDEEKEVATKLDVLAKTGFESRIYGEQILYTEDESGVLWIAHERQLIGYNPESGKATYLDFSDQPGFGNQYIRSVHAQGLKKLGIFTDNHYFTYDQTTDVLMQTATYNIPSGLPGFANLMNLHQEKSGTLWMSTDDSRVVLFDPLTQTFTDYTLLDEAGKSHGRIRSIIQDQQKIWWLATPNKGVYFSYPDNRNTFRHYLETADDSTGLNNNTASAILKTMDGRTWIGTDGGGVNIADPYTGEFTYYTHNPADSTSIGSNSVLTIFQDSYGRILLGGYQGGVSVYNFARDNFIVFKPNPDDPNSLSHHDVRGIMEIGDGQYLVAQNGGEGLQILDIYSGKFINFDWKPDLDGGDIVSHWLTTIYKDPNGDIWLGGYGGLGKFDPNSGTSENYTTIENDTTSLSNSWVYCIMTDSEGTLWVGTAYGLNRFDRETETFTSFTERDGLPDNIIAGIAEDESNHLWIATNKGISRLNKETLEFSNYDKSDGLKVEQFIHGSYFQDDAGVIYFGGNGGVVMINPEDFRKNEYVPPVYLTNFQLSYKTVPIGTKGSPLDRHIAFTDKVVLSHKQNMITFNYVALNFMSSRKNRYEYMMEGFDEEWKNVGSRREATYTNLNPGKYVFRVRAYNNDGVLNEEGTSVEITIRPPWWGTWLFRIIVILLIGYGIYSVIRIREQASRRDKEILRQKIDAGEQEVQKQKDEIAAQRQALAEKEASERESKWYNENLAKLGNIINANNRDLYKMSHSLISEIAHVVDANLGAIYVLNAEEHEEPNFEMVGNFGIDQARVRTRFNVNEGYLQAIYNEKQNIIIDNLPENYAVMKSGLGSVSMKHLLLIPLLQDENLKGVIELASLEKLEQVKVDLILQLAANMASAIEILSSSERMKRVLEELNTHTEELNAQKEEMQQNMEEMMATQEEIGRIRKEEKKKEKEILKQNQLLKEKEEELKKLQRQFNKAVKELEQYKK